MVPPSSETTPRRSELFVCAWAFAALFHQASFQRLGAGWLDGALSLSAFATLLAPARLSRPAFVLLLVLELADVLGRSPVLSNHWWISGFVASALLISLGAGLLRVRRGPPSAGPAANDPRDFVEDAAPVLRAYLLVIYFFGVFHKLNLDFLDPEVSCGAELYAALVRDFLPWLPEGEGAAWFAIISTLVVESLIPICLLWPRARGLGVLLGLGFHFGLGFVPYSVYYNFSSMLFALFVLYLPRDWATRVRARVDARGSRGARISSALYRHRRALLLAFGVALLLAAVDGSAHRAQWRLFWRLPWLGYGTLLIAAHLASAPWRDAGEAGRLTWGPRPRAALVLVALFAFNGAAPYLGLKTETSLAMYSNLRTEGGRSNHLLVRRPADWFGWQKDLVRIESSSDPRLRRYAREGQGVVWFELRDRLHRRPDASVSFERDRRREWVPRAGDDPRFATPTPRWLRKLVRFRAVDLERPQRCVH